MTLVVPVYVFDFWCVMGKYIVYVCVSVLGGVLESDIYVVCYI